MNTSEKILDIMVDIHRIRAQIKKLDRKENFSKSIPNTYLDVLQYLQEAAYFMADFYVALSPSEIDDDSEILENSL